jgi:hypothetical protein
MMLYTPRCSWADDAVDLRCPRARSAIVLPDPTTSKACDAIEPASSLSRQCCCPPQARKATLYILLCHFGPTNPDFDMLHWHIALIWYIAFVLLHCFDVLHCHIALICYIAFNMSYCFDMLHCFWYVTLLWYAIMLWYATLPHCFDMLHCFCSATLLWCATLPHCFDMLHCLYYVALLWYATLLLIYCIALIFYIATLPHC